MSLLASLDLRKEGYREHEDSTDDDLRSRRSRRSRHPYFDMSPPHARFPACGLPRAVMAFCLCTVAAIALLNLGGEDHQCVTFGMTCGEGKRCCGQLMCMRPAQGDHLNLPKCVPLKTNTSTSVRTIAKRMADPSPDQSSSPELHFQHLIGRRYTEKNVRGSSKGDTFCSHDLPKNARVLFPDTVFDFGDEDPSRLNVILDFNGVAVFVKFF